MKITSFETFMKVLPDGGKRLSPEVIERLQTQYRSYARWEKCYNDAMDFHFNNKSGIDNSIDVQKNSQMAYNERKKLVEEIADVKLNYYPTETISEDIDENNPLAM